MKLVHLCLGPTAQKYKFTHKSSWTELKAPKSKQLYQSGPAGQDCLAIGTCWVYQVSPAAHIVLWQLVGQAPPPLYCRTSDGTCSTPGKLKF